jgi:hypothetical protein
VTIPQEIGEKAKDHWLIRPYLFSALSSRYRGLPFASIRETMDMTD